MKEGKNKDIISIEQKHNIYDSFDIHCSGKSSSSFTCYVFRENIIKMCDFLKIFLENVQNLCALNVFFLSKAKFFLNLPPSCRNQNDKRGSERPRCEPVALVHDEPYQRRGILPEL